MVHVHHIESFLSMPRLLTEHRHIDAECCQSLWPFLVIGGGEDERWRCRHMQPDIGHHFLIELAG